ncbi:MAG: 5-formyltetrahydrofolate cyclo-ligase [Bacillota bacterium]|nr:5-formyltetrahydrofolate cyclo-ligase [Bacillota bacterium]
MKIQLRQDALAKRNAIPAAERAEKSRRIMAHILESDAYKKARRVFTFVSIGSEVDTGALLLQAWRDGKGVAVPKTAANRKMNFWRIESYGDLRIGRFGVSEPCYGTIVTPEEGDLFLVPGLLFDREKNRLGYGGGYYDTYFKNHGGFRRIGVAFSEQLSETTIPVGEFDIPLDDIVTENGWEVEG